MQCNALNNKRKVEAAKTVRTRLLLEGWRDWKKRCGWRHHNVTQARRSQNPWHLQSADVLLANSFVCLDSHNFLTTTVYDISTGTSERSQRETTQHLYRNEQSNNNNNRRTMMLPNHALALAYLVANGAMAFTGEWQIFMFWNSCLSKVKLLETWILLLFSTWRECLVDPWQRMLPMIFSFHVFVDMDWTSLAFTEGVSRWECRMGEIPLAWRV